MTEKKKYSNALAKESSPYLLQHAQNPVNWFPWGEAALQKAKSENKLLLVSIGYSACHWCHVMEKESFEDEEIAALMNASFVCIKVDREERPDVDAVYMNAVQLLNGQGGWPLNCFALPDGQPFYGGTYFPKDVWKRVLQNIDNAYRNEPQKIIDYAARLSAGIRENDFIEKNENDSGINISLLEKTVENWKKRLDNIEGGPDKAPKFPLPNNYLFLLHYAVLTKDNTLLQHVNLTMQKMAFGGIYDQIGGGFARYSTDYYWKVPHFEKMLYDNAQLVSLYSEAFQLTKNKLYKETVYQTLDFISRELTSPEHSFYSALDADSEGEEGKFYVWKEEELKRLLPDDFYWVKNYYNINEKGFWEHGNYILLRAESDETFAAANRFGLNELKEKIQSVKNILLNERNKRIRPGVDDKQLTSWNALMIKGYADAYRVFREENFLKAALAGAHFILTKQKKPDGGLRHNYKNGKSTINGFLEDYCFTIEAFISLYEVTFDFMWLNQARTFAEYCFAHFLNPETGMFFFTSDEDEILVARKCEIHDNVIPASNSSLARSLFLLGKYFDDEKYSNTARQMLNNITPFIPAHGAAYSNWAMLATNYTFPFYEVAVCGKNAIEKTKELEQYFIPNKLICGAKNKKDENSLPLTKEKFSEGKTLIYVCINKTCKQPHQTTQAAVEEMFGNMK